MAQERRQHLRIDDQVYFDFRIKQAGDFSSELGLRGELLGENGQKYLESIHYFQAIDYELAGLSKVVKEPALLRYLALLNAKIDYLSHQMLIPSHIKRHKVNLSLGGIAFKTEQLIAEETSIKIVLFTKPNLVPIIVDATVVYSQYQSEGYYRTAVSYNGLTAEQEQLLAQHILLAQVKCHAD